MRLLAVFLLVALPALWTGCMFDHTNTDVADRPEIDVGSGATIIQPGQASPGMPKRSGGSSAGSNASAEEPAADDGITMIGGAGGTADASSESRQMPLIGPLTVLFGYPFWIFGKSIHQKADKAKDEMESGEPIAGGRASETTRPRTPDDLERQRIARENKEMLEQIREKRAQAPPAGTPSSISAELAALERSLQGEQTRATFASMGPTPRDAVDRNGDGAPDLWIFDEGSHLREVFDDNHDGRPDKQHSYDGDGDLIRSEEDNDGDGRYETTMVFEKGEPQRKRADTDGDGQVDTWSFYQKGELARHEVDRDKDGFRDLVLLYQEGQLAREEEDKNGDGKADLIVHYRNGELFQRDEDLDFDGSPDVQSFYEKGRLVRREVVSEELLEAPGS